MPPGPKDLFGPILIGLLFDAILLGAFAIQALAYFYRFRRDRSWFKLLIAYLLIMEIINTAFDFATAYESLIQNFGTPVDLRQAPTYLLADPITTTLVSTPVQLFMAWRVKVISRTILTPMFIVVLSAISFAGSVWLSHQIHTDAMRSARTEAASATWLVASSITDVTISVAIVYFIVVQRRTMTRGKQFSLYLSRIMRFAVESGILTSVSMMLALIVFLAVQQGPYFLIWDLSFSKLYTNSLIVSLNARPVRNQEELARPLLFVDDSTFGKSSLSSKINTINGAGLPSTRPREDAIELAMTMVHHSSPIRPPERTTLAGQVPNPITSVAGLRVNVIYPDESGRYRTGTPTAPAGPSSSHHQPVSQHLERQDA
ncbi:hypothetical protein L218DRAFT_1000434 [Marasmius fiardii PR-910]|nr:hypothetical protein L218DRAFT_1000434 [Marasmius fiardii PR-910]